MLYERLVKKSGDLWSRYVNHEFAILIANNTMKKERFKHYLQQDYLYLICYRKCFEHLQQYAGSELERDFFKRNTINGIEKDLALRFNVDVEGIISTRQTNEYINYLYECLATKTALEKLVCLAPCAIGYGVLGNFISSFNIDKSNDYIEWIETYDSKMYNTVVEEYIGLLNAYEVSDDEFEVLSKIFNKVCELEISFFDQVLSTAKPIVLTIAGCDSSGGAGIQADIKTISANGGYAASAITAITAQNTTGVNSVVELEVDIIKDQINAVISDLDVLAIKIGMLGNSKIINAVASVLNDGVNVILDPVMLAKDGSVLLDLEAITVLVSEMFPKALLITPNIDEAKQILDININNEEDMEVACLEFQKLGATNVLIKGGHLESNKLVDVLYYNNEFYKFYQERIDTIHTHGTGCSLSSAIATNIAKGQTLDSAVCNAIKYVYDGILLNYKVGNGKSPINHFHSKGAYYDKSC